MKCSLKRNCVKSVLGLKTPLKDPVHWKPGFKVSAIKFHVCSVSKKELQHMNVNILQRCKE
jgi:hypothetical protein